METNGVRPTAKLRVIRMLPTMKLIRSLLSVGAVVEVVGCGVSTATCGATGPSTTGNSEIEGLVLDNTAIFVTGQPNQTVAFPGGMLIINEQTSAGSGDLTVNAVHLIVFGVADVIISLAHADITCG